MCLRYRTGVTACELASGRHVGYAIAGIWVMPSRTPSGYRSRAVRASELVFLGYPPGLCYHANKVALTIGLSLHATPLMSELQVWSYPAHGSLTRVHRGGGWEDLHGLYGQTPVFAVGG